jgi:hypothetical protein
MFAAVDLGQFYACCTGHFFQYLQRAGESNLSPCRKTASSFMQKVTALLAGERHFDRVI